jgi:nitronate monooxygenase
MPSPEHLRALRARSILLIGTATNLAEVEALDELGVDANCAQGAEAGGHRGTFLGSFEDAMSAQWPWCRWRCVEFDDR